MDPQIKAQWLAALRSGEYRQGKRVLHNVDENTFCCLGVLCDLAVRAGVVSEGRHKYNLRVAADIEVYGSDGDCRSQGGVTLPDEVQEWAGLDSDNPWVGDSGVLAELNDMGRSFEELANLIDRDL